MEDQDGRNDPLGIDMPKEGAIQAPWRRQNELESERGTLRRADKKE